MRLIPCLSLLACLLTVPIVSQGEDWISLYGSARQRAKAISSSALAVPLSPEEWTASVETRRKQWREMLGLSPLPPRTPLNVQVTDILQRDGYVIEKLAFESLPGVYVYGNLYRPTVVEKPLPAVLYLCGHAYGKASPIYQKHPRWFAQHGYVSLILDPIQLGESKGEHHGTYRQGRWDWHSRGYTPAGAEVWNAMRALDYLETRPDVDATRFGVTGNSGGGVISWCLGAADVRVKVVVPVCQSGSIAQVVADRSIDNHCDCAFWNNYYRWCWPDIGSLIAPRALLIASGSDDILWRPAGYRDVAQRIRRQYAALGKPEQFDLVEDATPHGYTPKLRQAIFTWFNTHLKDDPAPVTDDVTELVEPIAELQVFKDSSPTGRIIEVDKRLLAEAPLPTITTEAEWIHYRDETLQRLKETTFRETVSDSRPLLDESRDDGRALPVDVRYGTHWFHGSDALPVAVRTTRSAEISSQPLPALALAAQPEDRSTTSGGKASRPQLDAKVITGVVEVRNTGASSVGPGLFWTIQRTYPLFGETLAERQVCDLLGGIEILRREPGVGSVAVYGDGATAPLAIYAALLDQSIEEIVLANPPVTHTNPEAAQFLGVLRTGDLPHNLALAYPRPITFIGQMPKEYEWTKQLYETLGAGHQVRVVKSMRVWEPAAGTAQRSAKSAP
ncbi:alpha/beta hydrolase family protein [Planctomicrobium sp. SH664]|uniref:alpha/beta hydrolase family protein n=1 Tax=Planctomicrobium sp. SH664 TaxID=3448125 RepID=UPI003F5B47BC